eukprot:scaffold704_cov347-Prasinococcus_capsulatus_cf.AAC.31
MQALGFAAPAKADAAQQQQQLTELRDAISEHVATGREDAGTAKDDSKGSRTSTGNYDEEERAWREALDGSLARAGELGSFFPRRESSSQQFEVRAQRPAAISVLHLPSRACPPATQEASGGGDVAELAQLRAVGQLDAGGGGHRRAWRAHRATAEAGHRDLRRGPVGLPSFPASHRHAERVPRPKAECRVPQAAAGPLRRLARAWPAHGGGDASAPVERRAASSQRGLAHASSPHVGAPRGVRGRGATRCRRHRRRVLGHLLSAARYAVEHQPRSAVACG